MNKQNLIFTSTVGMERETWLEFRQPISHIKNFITNWVNEKSKQHLPGSKTDHSEKSFFSNSHEFIYAVLKDCFRSEEWNKFIFPCIGASEIATIMALNPYKSIIELYYEKIGAKEVLDFDNAAMFWGRELEEPIAEKWQYWDGSIETMIDNFKAKNKLRKCRRVNAYIQNKQYPWIFVSLDRAINKQRLSEEETLNEGSLEVKTISGYAAAMWESEIPIMYVVQLQTQLLACDFQFGEIAILKDGRHFEVYPFDRHEDLVTRIANESKDFFNLVKKGAEEFLLYKYSPSEVEGQQHYSELERIAPEPDGSEAYKNYLSDKYQNATTEGIPGGPVQVELAKSYKYFGERKKQCEALQMECSNKLKGFMKDAATLDLGEAGKCTWKDNAKGSRTFLVQVKVEADFKPTHFDELEELPEVKEQAEEKKTPAKKEEKGVLDVPFENDSTVKRDKKKKSA